MTIKSEFYLLVHLFFILMQILQKKIISKEIIPEVSNIFAMLMQGGLHLQFLQIIIKNVLTLMKDLGIDIRAMILNFICSFAHLHHNEMVFKTFN